MFASIKWSFERIVRKHFEHDLSPKWKHRREQEDEEEERLSRYRGKNMLLVG